MSTNPEQNKFLNFRKKAASGLKNPESIWGVWIKINQGLTAIAFIVALIALIVTLIKNDNDSLKYQEDRVGKAWDALLRMAGKQSNGGQSDAIGLLVSQNIPLDQVDLKNTYLAKSKIKNASFIKANLFAANLSNSDLRNANFKGADLRNVDMSGSNLTGAIFLDANVSKANFSGATIDISIIDASDLTQADVTGAKFTFVDDSGKEDWPMFADTLGASSNVDNLIKLCDNSDYRLPHNYNISKKLNLDKCKTPYDYSNLKKTKIVTNRSKASVLLPGQHR